MEHDDQLIGASIVFTVTCLITMLICKFVPGYMRGNLLIDAVVAILTFSAIFLMIIVVIAIFQK